MEWKTKAGQIEQHNSTILNFQLRCATSFANYQSKRMVSLEDFSHIIVLDSKKDEADRIMQQHKGNTAITIVHNYALFQSDANMYFSLFPIEEIFKGKESFAPYDPHRNVDSLDRLAEENPKKARKNGLFKMKHHTVLAGEMTRIQREVENYATMNLFVKNLQDYPLAQFLLGKNVTPFKQALERNGREIFKIQVPAEEHLVRVMKPVQTTVMTYDITNDSVNAYPVGNMHSISKPILFMKEKDI